MSIEMRIIIIQMEAALTLALLGQSNSGKTALVRAATNNQAEIFPTAGM